MTIYHSIARTTMVHNLDLDTLRDTQIEDGQTAEVDDYARDARGRYLLKEHRLPHLIVAIHVQINHITPARDKKTLEDYAVLGRTRQELTNIMYAYRQLCSHSSRYPYLLRMPLNRILIGRKPRAVLRMDCLYISKTGGHLLVIIDTFSRKRDLKHSLSEDARTAMEGSLKWHSNFVLIMDNGSHFANQVMQYAIHALRGRHEFSIPFAPFTNGSCENRNRHVLRILR